MWTDDNLMVMRPEDQVDRYGVVPLMEASQSVGGWGVVLVRANRAEKKGRTHIHIGESEAFFLVDGEVDLCGVSSTTRLEPGSFALVPPDTEHGLLVRSETASWLAIWPAALDGLVEKLATARDGGDVDLAALDEIRRSHAIEPGRPIVVDSSD